MKQNSLFIVLFLVVVVLHTQCLAKPYRFHKNNDVRRFFNTLQVSKQFPAAKRQRCFNVLFWSKKGRNVYNVIISTPYRRGFTNVFTTFINQRSSHVRSSLILEIRLQATCSCSIFTSTKVLGYVFNLVCLPACLTCLLPFISLTPN